MIIEHRLTKQAGVSILEVLIALIITGIITTAIFRLYITQHKNYIVQDDITEIQQSARAAIDELSRHIRVAGNNLPNGIPPLAASNTNPDTITLTYRVDDCETVLDTTMAYPTAELACNSSVACFQPGDWVYIFHPDSGGGEWFSISGVLTGNNHLQHTSPLSQAYVKDAIIISLQQVKFYIDNTTDPAHPNLMLVLPGQAPQVYAENISDLEFRYRLKNGTVVDYPILVDDVREVLMSITARSRTPDTEDTDDPYRSRTYTSSVNIRNLGA